MAEGGGRNVAWGVAVRWGLDALTSINEPITPFKHTCHDFLLTLIHTLPKLSTAFRYGLYVVQ